MKNAKRLLMNTAVLTLASILMQTVGVAFNVYLTNRLGSAGIGLFSLIMTVYALSVTLSCGGIRLASTRLTVEGETDKIPQRHTMGRCILYALITGSLIAVCLFAGAETISRLWLEDMRCERPLKLLAACLPFVAMSSAMNGYFTAKRKILKYSLVRILEQGVRIVTVAACLMKFLQNGLEHGCIAIVCGTLVSEIFSFSLLFVLYLIDTAKSNGDNRPRLLYKLLRIALPDVTGSGMRSVLLTIEHILIPVGFRKSGSSADEALSIYGNVHGKVFPLLLYPSAVFSSLSGLLVPEIAEFNSVNMTERINYIINRVLKLTLMYSICTSGIMYAFSQGLSMIIYNNNESVLYIQILAPLIPIMYCDMTVDGMLKGLDQQFYSMLYNIFDSGLCVILVYLILPRFAVKGYIFILFTSEILNFYMSIRRLIKVSEINISILNDVALPAGCAICSVTVGKLLLGTLCAGSFSVIPVALCIVLSAVLYFFMLRTFGCITSDDISWAKGCLTGR